MRIALAPRVSSDMQFEKGWSFQDQVDRGHAWAAREGHQVVKVYFQPGVSAATSDRQELLDIVEGARRNEYDALWIRDLMRFSRAPDDDKYLREIEFVHRKQIIEDGRAITVLTPEGKLDVDVRLSLGSYQVSIIRKVTSQGKAKRASAGRPNFSTPPTGYRLVNGEVLPREDNAAGVQLIFDLYSRGRRTEDIVRAFNEAGYRTNDGVPLSRDTLAAILRNKFYCGYVSYRGLEEIYTEPKRRRKSKRDIRWIKATHTPLIDEKTWQMCEAIRRERATTYNPRRHSERVYVFAGITYCAHCGGRLRAQRWGGNVRSLRKSYRCTAVDRGHVCGARRKTIPEEPLTEQLDALMTRLTLPWDVKRRAEAMIRAQDYGRKVRAELERVRAQLRRMRTNFERGLYDQDESEFYRAAEALKARIQQMETDLGSSEHGEMEEAIRLLDDFSAMWRNADERERRAICATLFDRIIVNLDTRLVARWEPKNRFAAIFDGGEYS